jgi:predicted dehydrogenase
MSKPRLGIIGADWNGEGLARLLAPLRKLDLACWSPGPDNSDAVLAGRLAAETGAVFVADWQDIARDPLLQVVALIGETNRRASAVLACLQTRKTVLCLGPTFIDQTQLQQAVEAQRAGGSTLLVAGEIAHTQAGAHALGVVRNGSLGAIRSVYMALRSPRAETRSVPIDRLRWEAFDFLLAMGLGPIETVYASSTRLFAEHGPDDTALIILRLACDALITIELSHCLPSTIPAVGLGEVEVEVIGTRQTIRLDPHNSDLRVFTDHDITPRPWVDGALASLLNSIEPGQGAGEHWIVHQGNLIDLTGAAMESVACGQPVAIRNQEVRAT